MKRVMLALLATTSALGSSAAWAQKAPVAPPSDQAADEQSDGAEIIVTGSSIRGAAPVGSELITLNRDQIQKTGIQDTATLFNSVPQVSQFGSTPKAANGAGSPTNPPALRGLGAGATLTLVNGHRLPGLGTISTQPDPSLIPIAAISRVEVLVDGASSTYGSDAVGGVINIILRHDLDGVDASANYGFADSYRQLTASLVAGKHWSGGSLLIGYQYSHNDALFAADRDYVTSNLSAYGGVDGRSIFSSNPNVIVGSQQFNYNYATGTFTPGLVMTDLARLRNLLPQAVKHSAVANFEHQLSESVRLFADANYGHLFSNDISEPEGALLPITSANPYFRSPVPGATSEDVGYSFIRELGMTNDHQTLEYYGGRLGAHIGFAQRWNLSLWTNYQHGYVIVERGSLSEDALSAALASTDPATAFDPFTGKTSDSVLQAIRSGNQNTPSSNQTMYQAVASVDGTVFSIPGGDVRAAFGAEYRRETYRGVIDTSTPTVPSATRAGGIRTIKSAYGEINIPIVGRDNASRGLQNLTVTGSLRFDQYSDFGSTTNPKFGIQYNPIDTVRFRGSYSKSFRAPNLSDLYSSDSRAQYLEDVYSPDFFTPIAPGPRTGGGYNVLLLAGGNLALQPEKARLYSFGADFTPTEDLHFGFTYYNIDYQGIIDFARGAFTNPDLYARFITPNPTPSQIHAAIALMPAVWGIPLPDSSIDLIADLRRNNLGRTKISGLDFEAALKIPSASAGDFYFGFNANYVVRQKTQAATGAAYVNNLNTGTVRWRGRAQAGWSLRPVDLNFFGNFVGPYTNTGITPVQRVRAWASVDATLGVDLGSLSVIRNARLEVSAMNLLNARPPISYTAPGYGVTGSPLGRLMQVGVRTKF